MPKAKKVIKKVVKTTKKETKATAKAVEQPLYNEYGTCIACQNGNPDCLHTNLIQGQGGSLTCATCGACVSA